MPWSTHPEKLIFGKVKKKTYQEIISNKITTASIKHIDGSSLKASSGQFFANRKSSEDFKKELNFLV